jgi:hypothetical protein
MSEQGPEQSGEGLSTEKVLQKLKELAQEGRIDFTEEDITHVRTMEADEAVSYLMFALAEAGEDPEVFLLESAIAQYIETDEEAGSGE